MIVLKCREGQIKILINGEDRSIICYKGSNLCAKPENQGTFDMNCFTVEEKIRG